MSKIKTVYAVVPQTVADGRATITCGNVTRCRTHEEALRIATNRLDKRSYNGMVIYQAVTLVQRSAPPTEVIHLDDETGRACWKGD